METKAVRSTGVFAIRTHRACAGLSLLTLILMSLIFAPVSFWPVSFVCLVPWLVMVGHSDRAPRVYLYTCLMALAFFFFNMRWLYPATGFGYTALSVYQAFYVLFAACTIRHVVRRRCWPLALLFPIVWVGTEMLRAVVISGFPWFFLSHSLYEVLTLIQVSDIVGAYGVSFMVAAVNGALADVIPMRLGVGSTEAPVLSPGAAKAGVLFTCVVVLAAVVYGVVSLRSGTTTVGPRVAVVQGDYVNAVYLEEVPEEEQVSEVQKMREYLSMMQKASAENPDLYLLPESPWPMFLNAEARDLTPLSRESFRRLQRHATEHNAYVVTGSASMVRTPLDLHAKRRTYNSATIFYPDGREPDRYDKVHLVYFGEAVPFRFGKLRFLYFWLNSLMPFSGEDGDYEYSIFRGREFRVFEMAPASRPGSRYRFGTPICYEDVMPYVSRRFVGGSTKKKADMLLNISNDGWFGRGIQQPQHLAICVFRAVENRVGIARAVNTGVSGFVDPSGRLHDLVEGGGSSQGGGNSGYAVANVGIDSRYTLYTRYGDWFGWACAFVCMVLFLDYWIARARALREQ